MCIVEINQIWVIDGKFGVSMKLLQVLLEPSKKIAKFAFKLPASAAAPVAMEEGEDEEMEDGEEEEEDQNTDVDE